MASHGRIELRKRVVEQQDRRGSRRLGHRQDFGEPERQRGEPLLTARAEYARVDAVDLDRQIVAVRTQQRLASTNLLALTPLERREKRRRFGGFAERRPIADLDFGSGP